MGLLAAIALLAACGGTESTTAPAATDQLAASAERNLSPTVQRQLARLRQVTASFHDIDAAATAGWSTQITGCMVSEAGGMGFHYGNTSLIDGTVRVEQPELLLYEPEKNGGMRLVAVEYIIPYTAHARSDAPPVLFGQQFKRNDTFQLWGLHAWVWAENPSGMFADWNPRVTCEFAPDGTTMPMSH
jgi:hypothetical protein